MHSQALLGQRGGHLVGQRGELRRVGHVDAAGGGHGAELVGGVFQRDDLSAVVSAGLGCLAEAQFVALNLRSDTRVEVRHTGGGHAWVTCCTAPSGGQTRALKRLLGHKMGPKDLRFTPQS